MTHKETKVLLFAALTASMTEGAEKFLKDYGIDEDAFNSLTKKMADLSDEVRRVSGEEAYMQASVSAAIHLGFHLKMLMDSGVMSQAAKAAAKTPWKKRATQ